jgi:hypothetical protein
MRLTKSGASLSNRQKLKRSTTSSRRSVTAVTVADRGSPSSRLISPKKSPGRSGSPMPTGVCTDTWPSMMKKKESPGVPISVNTVPAGVSTIFEISAIRRSSSSVQSLNKGTRRRWSIRASRERRPATVSLVSASWKLCTGEISGRLRAKISSDLSITTTSSFCSKVLPPNRSLAARAEGCSGPLSSSADGPCQDGRTDAAEGQPADCSTNVHQPRMARNSGVAMASALSSS